VRRLARPLVYLGTASVVLGLGKFHARYVGHYVFHNSSRLSWSIAYIAILCVAAYAAGIPDLYKGIRTSAVAAAGATSAGALGISAVQLLVGSLLLPRLVVLLSAVLLVPWYVACSLLASRGRAREAERDRVVGVITSEEASVLATELRRSAERPASLERVVDIDQVVPDSPWAEPLVDLAIEVDASVLVLDVAAQANEGIVHQAAALHESGVRVRTLALFYDEWLGKLPISELERVSLMFDIGELHRARYVRMKRLLDVVVGLAGLAILLVLIPFVALGDLVANRGPMFYMQPRVGRHERPFQILKFRTMSPGGEDTEWTAEHDTRITPFGRWLRRSHIDELPQVVNVLRGDLSVVGPRPEQPKYVAELEQKIPFYRLRHLVRPGLTGWAQVKYTYGASDMDALEKLQYEFYYLRHQGLLLDMRIIGRTIRSVIGRGGR
jgi:lipopolysaccharide/colanic/teichoic acid biosynthesis glycosyltransferase